MKPFQASGLWYLPAKPQDPIAGELRYDLDRGILLTLTGSLQDTLSPDSPRDYPVIHGVVADSPYGRLVTLADCFRRQARLSIPGFATEEIRVNRAYLGAHLADEEETFSSVRVLYSGLDGWSGLTGFNVNVPGDQDHAARIANYIPPQPLEIPLDDRLLYVEARFTISEAFRRFSVTEQVHATFRGPGLTPTETLRNYVSPLQDFLTFATDAPSTVEELALLDPDSKEDGHRIRDPIHMLYHPIVPNAPDNGKAGSSDRVFWWPDVRDAHPDVVAHWFRFRKTFKTFRDLYFGILYAPPTYLDLKILLLLTALSALLDDSSVPDQILREALIPREMGRNQVSHERDERWLSATLPTQSEISLPWRLFDLLNRHTTLMSTVIADFEAFVTAAVEARQALLHRPERPHPYLRNLLTLSERLMLIAKLGVLSHLGFATDEAMACVARTRGYRYLLQVGPDS